MRVAAQRQAEVPGILWPVIGLCLGAEDLFHHLCLVLGIRSQGNEAVKGGGGDDLPQREFDAKGFEIVLERDQFFAARRFVDTVHNRRLFGLQCFGCCDVGRDHEILDQAVGVEAFADGHTDDAARFVEDNAAFGEVERKRFACVAGLGKQRPCRPEVAEMVGRVAAVEACLRVFIGDVRRHPNDRPREAPVGDAPLCIDFHVTGERRTILPFLQRANIGGEFLGQHRHDAIREIDAVAALFCLAVEVGAGADVE